MAKGKKTGGRQKGSLNKTTAEAKEVFAAFVKRNAFRLQEWLDQIAQGVKKRDGSYVVAPNPEKAFELFLRAAEHHVPKLARTTIVSDPENPVPPPAEVTVNNINMPGLDLSNLTDEQIKVLHEIATRNTSGNQQS